MAEEIIESEGVVLGSLTPYQEFEYQGCRYRIITTGAQVKVRLLESGEEKEESILAPDLLVICPSRV